MISKLASWGLNFEAINISKSPEHKPLLKEAGVKTVPALFLKDFWINENIDTEAFTESMFYDRLDVMLEQKTPAEIDEILEGSNEN